MDPDLNYECMRDIDYENLPKRIKDLMKIPQHEQRSQEWFDQRKGRLTASNVDAVLGRSKYQCRTEVLFKKCGLSKPFTGNKFCDHGVKYENEAIENYCRIYNKKLIEFGLLDHPDIDFLAGSFDGIVFTNGDPDTPPQVIEVKCPYSRKIKYGEIPDHYLSQLLVNMEISRCDGIFIEYIPPGFSPQGGGGMKLNVIHLKREPKWLPSVLPTLREFWNEVLHYREEGIDKHDEHSKYLRKSRPKKILDFTSNEPKKIESMFIDDL